MSRAQAAGRGGGGGGRTTVGEGGAVVLQLGDPVGQPPVRHVLRGWNTHTGNFFVSVFCLFRSKTSL